ncbi:MAG: hypothetical protein IJY62_04760 [Clostridia bacterium]|nr:hypothetical protein [Clostridia bacterium]
MFDFLENKFLRFLFYVGTMILSIVIANAIVDFTIFESEATASFICFGISILPLSLALDFMQSSKKQKFRTVVFIFSIVLSVLPAAILHIKALSYYADPENYNEFYKCFDFFILPTVAMCISLFYINCGIWEWNTFCVWFIFGSFAAMMLLTRIVFAIFSSFVATGVFMLVVALIWFAVIVILRLKYGTAFVPNYY